MAKEDFILTTYRLNLLDFDFQNEKYCWKDSTWSDKSKKKKFFQTSEEYTFIVLKLKPGNFISPAEKEILSLMTPAFSKILKVVKENDSIQSLFFYMIAQT